MAEDETDRGHEVDEPPKCIVHRVLPGTVDGEDDGRFGVMGIDESDVEAARLPPFSTGLGMLFY